MGERLTIRAALLLGFGVTLGLWLFAGSYFANRTAELGRQSEATNARYMRAQELLSTVRAQVLLGSVFVRDALLDPAGVADDYRQKMQDSYRTADEALRQYEPVLDSPAERDHISQLRREVDEFHSMLLDVLATDARRWSAGARDLLRLTIVPKRQVVIRVSEEVQALNRAAFIQQQAGVAATYRATENRIWLSLGVALLASLGIGLVATAYAVRLENRLKSQRAKEEQTARDLQRLSARLVGAQEEERRTIARELHDDVGQMLTAMKVELAVAEHAIDAAGGPAQILSPTRSIADRALRTVRDLSHLLHPAMLDDLGLPEAVAAHLRGVGDRHGLRVELLRDGVDERLAPEVEAAAFRIVQEALTNVANHAQARSCRVFLQRLPHTLLVTVDDDGKGFDSASGDDGRARPGLGLIGIRERVALLHGTLRLESAPGKGTRLTVELPARSRGHVEDESPEALSGVGA